MNDFERINTSLKRSLSSSPKDPERFSTSVYGVKQTLTNTLNDVKRLSTSQNYFKRSLSSSPVDPEKLTDFKSYESSFMNVFESSSSTSSNTSLNISTNPFTHAQGDSESSLGTTLNGFENQSESEMVSTLQNVSETSLSTSQKKSKWSLSTSSNDSKRSISLTANNFERSLNTSPNNLSWSMNTSLDDSIIFFNTSANDTEGLNASPNSSEKFSINTQNESERHPNMSKGSSGTARNYLKSSSNTSANNSGRALSTSSNIFERSLPNTYVSSPSTVLNYSNISVSSTLNNSGFTLNTLLNNPKRSLNTATNQTDGATSPATSIHVDFNNVTDDSSEEGSFVTSSVPPIDYYTNSSSFTSHAETITATSHLVPRITDNFLNTTFFSTINNITKFIATTLSSTRSGSQSLMNSSRELNSNFTTANSSEIDFVESKTNDTHAARTTPLSGPPEGRTDSPRITLSKPTHAHVSLSTIESLKEEAVRTSSTPVVATFGSNTGSYTVISQVSTDIPKTTLINITRSEFATTRSSPALLTSLLPRDKTWTITIPTTSVIKTTEPGRTRTLATINTWTSIKTSTTTKTSTFSSTQTNAMIPTSTRTSDISIDLPAITMVSIPTTVPPTTVGRAATEPSTMIQVTTSISQVPTAENACISNPCLNGGTCINDHNSRRKCLCSPSWQGMNCSKDVDECLSNPCPSPAKCVNNLGSFSCKCQPGYYFEKGTGCILAKTFAGVLHMVNKSGISRHELEGDILKILNASLFSLNGYYTSVIADLSETNDSVSVLNMFVHSSNVTLQEARSSVQNYISSCQSNTGSCQIVLSQRLFYKAETLCSFTMPKCDNATAECNADSGTAECLCKDGYFKYNDMDHSCRACDDGYKLVNGTCTPCLFGFGGFNCKNPYKLITVVIAAAGGGLLLILGIALTITCCRKEKNDITKLIFKGAEFQRSTYAEFPKNPRISVEWGRETIEMQENGSTKNLLQMTDIYYSSGFRGSEVDRNGLHPYSGLPGSRYSCIYTGQYNPSFSSDESRRRDYF
ncbi:protein HEG [Hypanus sabinus]|uniref:protein HEG n=1 Tax=Hypanus sabinus TaxID=79690 RepID=UPI0028C4CE3A|nr:protein HEG [Hypanus sabinus]